MTTVLVIDDEEGIRNLLDTLRSRKGYDMVQAQSGQKGLMRFRLSRPDFVVLDLNMPEMNGLDMLVELTREFLHTKVIAISGAGGEHNGLDASKLLGARRTFLKPFSLPRLLDAGRYERDHRRRRPAARF